MDKITVSFKKLKKIVEVLEECDFKPDDEVAFEYIIGSLFPNVADNIKDALLYEHTAGFIEGLNTKMEEEEKEKKSLWPHGNNKELVS